MGKLDGRVMIVTGAGRGIGASIARMAAAEGARVVVADYGVNLDGTGSDAGPANQVVEEIRSKGGTAIPVFADVSNHEQAEGIIRTTLNEFGRLDVLVNVAGILRDRMVFNMTEEEWDAVVAVHMKGTFNTTKFASIYWRQAREGHYRLINFTSGSGLNGAPGQPNYAAAKMGIVGFTYSCANALGRYGVTANAISPGAATRMTQSVPEDRRRGMRAPDDDPSRSPDNVAPAVLYLASEHSDWITGQVIGASGFQISLYNKPSVISRVTSNGPWSLDDAFSKMEDAFRPLLEQSGGRREPAPSA